MLVLSLVVWLRSTCVWIQSKRLFLHFTTMFCHKLQFYLTQKVWNSGQAVCTCSGALFKNTLLTWHYSVNNWLCFFFFPDTSFLLICCCFFNVDTLRPVASSSVAWWRRSEPCLLSRSRGTGQFWQGEHAPCWLQPTPPSSKLMRLDTLRRLRKTMPK